MIERLEKFAERIRIFVKLFVKRVNKAIAWFLEELVYLFEAIAEWIIKTTKAILNYLSRLFNASFKIIVASVKLVIFYIPSIIFYILYYYYYAKIFLIICILWALLVTVVGIFYKFNEDEK